MKNIPKNEGLNDYQIYVYNALKERGFLDQDVNTRLTLLMEEIGELAKSIRKYNNERIDKKSKVNNLSDEIADVFFVLVSIANKCDINIADAFVRKEEINNKREWIVSIKEFNN